MRTPIINWSAGVVFGIGLERFFYPLPETVLWLTIVGVTVALLADTYQRQVMNA